MITSQQLVMFRQVSHNTLAMFMEPRIGDFVLSNSWCSPRPLRSLHITKNDAIDNSIPFLGTSLSRPENQSSNLSPRSPGLIPISWTSLISCAAHVCWDYGHRHVKCPSLPISSSSRLRITQYCRLSHLTSTGWQIVASYELKWYFKFTHNSQQLINARLMLLLCGSRLPTFDVH